MTLVKSSHKFSVWFLELVLFSLFSTFRLLFLLLLWLLWFTGLISALTIPLLWSSVELLEGKAWHSTTSLCHVHVHKRKAWAWTASSSTTTHRWSTKAHSKNARAHVMHTWTTTSSASKHLFERIHTSSAATSLASCHLLERLGKDLLYVSIAEELFENFFWIDVSEIGTSTCIHLCPKSIVMTTFVRVTQRAICRTDFFESFLCTWCSILVRMNF